MDGLNFWLMDACVTALVFCSVVYGRTVAANAKASEQRGRFLMIPDSFLAAAAGKQDGEPGDVEAEATRPNWRGRDASEYVVYGTLVVLYFGATTSAVILAKRFPIVAACVQYACIFTFIIFGMHYICPFARGSFCLAVLLCIGWAASGATPYRWLANNVIIAFSVLVAGHIRFKNFFYLQIFLWIAFVYDVIILSGIQLRTDDWNFFSLNERPCDRLICDLFIHNYHFQMPAVFTVNFISSQNQVFIGTGDILIGAIVANFAASFFNGLRYAAFTCVVFAAAVASLAAVSLTPFPALLTIVPACSVALLLCGLVTGTVKQLLVGRSSEDDFYFDEVVLMIY